MPTSTRGLYSAGKAFLGSYDYAPYGDTYRTWGASISTLGGAFTGKPWDNTTKLYSFPYREYSPTMARWTSRDPLGMVDGPNMYASVGWTFFICPRKSGIPSIHTN